MKHRTYALLLATALTLSLLAGCGPKGSDASGSQPSGSDVSSSQEDTSMPDASNPDVSLPDVSTSTPDGSTSTPDGSQTDSSKEDVEEPEVKASLSLNSSDFTLFSKGASHTLKATVTPAGTKVTFQSGNEKVATVDANGKVTAVAPGTAKITATAGDLTATCIVRCRWEESKPDQGGSSSSGSGSSSSNGGSTSTPSTDKVDLADFYATVTSSYEMPDMTLADSQLMDQYFPGLSAVATEQSQVYVNMMSMNMGEMALVQVKDSKDVDTVKAIFQARIDSMAQGGAWYPQCVELWTNNAQVVSNGNYIMMVASEDCDSIVKDFNALF